MQSVQCQQEQAVLVVKAAGPPWQPIVKPWTPSDFGDWLRPSDLLHDHVVREAVVKRLHESAVSSLGPDRVAGIKSWLEPRNVMWVLSVAVTKAIPPLYFAATNQSLPIALGPDDFAFRLARLKDNISRLEFRILPSAINPSKSLSVFESVQETIKQFAATEQLTTPPLVAFDAARFVGKYITDRAIVSADSAESALDLAHQLQEKLSPDLNAGSVSFKLLAIGNRAILRCYPRLCCNESSRYLNAICGACPKSWKDKDLARITRLKDEITNRGLPINSATPALRGSSIGDSQSGQRSIPASPEIAHQLEVLAGETVY